jgi:hypothetical protein
MRKSDIFLVVLGSLLALFVLMVAHSILGPRAMRPALAEKGRLVRELGLTDLCLATEANYTRHLSQADLSTAFQDHPVALDHFPSGIWLPPHLPPRQGYGQLGRTTEKHP